MRFLFTLLILFGLMAIQAQGQSVYRTYPGTFNTLMALPDGGFFITGHRDADSSLQLRRVDAQGNTLWERFWTDGQRHPTAVCAHPNGGYVVLTQDVLPAGSFTHEIRRVSADGVSMWRETINPATGWVELNSLLLTGDGGLMVVGYRNETGSANPFLIKFNAEGQMLWDKVLPTPEAEVNVRAIALPDGNIALGGDRVVGLENELFLMRSDANGNVLWSTNYGIPWYQAGGHMLLTPDGGFALLGNTYAANPNKVALVKTDAGGGLQWFRHFYPGSWQGPGMGELFAAGAFGVDAAGHFYLPIAFTERGNALRLFHLDEQGYLATPPQLLGYGIPYAIAQAPDQSFVIVGDRSPIDSAFFLKTAAAADFSHLIGHAFRDSDEDCAEDSGEAPFTQGLVEASDATGERYYAQTRTDGSFDLWVPAGTYDLSLHPPYGTPAAFWDPCPGPTGVSVGTNDSIQVGGLGMGTMADCPLMEVSVESGLLRRCTTTWYRVEYCNLGTQTAENVRVELELDSLLTYEQSSVPLGSQQGNRLIFPLPDLAAGDCGSFQVQLMVSCAAVNGQALCVDAYIFPDSTCLGNPGDGSRIAVNGSCHNGEIEFLVKNTGSGDMDEVAEYVIIEDQIMYHMGGFQLTAGEDTLVKIPNPSGRTYFLQTRPPNSQHRPSAVVQFCAGTGGASPLNFPFNSNGPATAVHCAEVRGSYDPNDIQGFPLGIGTENHIEPDQNLNYRIRFQNTGNDTAFLVVIRDTLPAELDPATVRPGPSSHPYTFDLREGGILTFTFRNILLPDSNTNEAASHGYVTYRISPLAGLPRDTRLLNRAGIYFDFNDPIITNTARHTIWKPLLTAVRPDPLRPQDWSVHVSPNPTNGPLFFQLPPQAPREGVQLMLFSAQGTLMQQTTCPNGTCHLDTAQLPQGPYWYALRDGQGVWRAKGRVMVF